MKMFFTLLGPVHQQKQLKAAQTHFGGRHNKVSNCVIAYRWSSYFVQPLLKDILYYSSHLGFR